MTQRISVPAVFHLDDAAFADEMKESNAPTEAIMEAARRGVRRKLLARGDSGFFTHFSEFPPDFVVAPHSHDQDELIFIVEGSLILGDGTTLGPCDSVVLPAYEEYGFACGEQGLKFFNVRRAKAAIQQQL